MIQAKPRKGRLIKKVLQRGKVWQGKLLRVKFLRQTEGTPPSLSVVVSAKTAPLATQRNKIKRRTKGAFRPLLEGVSGLTIVAFPSPQAAECNFKEIEEEAKQCLKGLQ